MGVPHESIQGYKETSIGGLRPGVDNGAETGMVEKVDEIRKSFHGVDAVDEGQADGGRFGGMDAWWCREVDSPEPVDAITRADSVCLSILGQQQDSVGSERCVVAIVAELANREEGMVGHARENMGTTSNGGQGREEYVGWKQGGVGGHWAGQQSNWK